jgi:hypothetical protein
MRTNRFGEIQAWQEARKLVKMVYDMINRNRALDKEPVWKMTSNLIKYPNSFLKIRLASAARRDE